MQRDVQRYEKGAHRIYLRIRATAVYGVRPQDGGGCLSRADIQDRLTCILLKVTMSCSHETLTVTEVTWMISCWIYPIP